MYNWHQHDGRPRKRHLDWCRHLPRELNAEADALATKGKHLLDAGVSMYLLKCWKGLLYTLNSFSEAFGMVVTNQAIFVCGIGVLIEFNEHIPHHKPNGWRVAVKAHGKRSGRSAISAGVEAAKTLIQLAHSLLFNRSLQLS